MSIQEEFLARYVSRDIRTTTARTLQVLRDQAGINPWTDASSQLKDTLTENLLVEVPPQDQWRLKGIWS